jgi:hypothetical protein
VCCINPDSCGAFDPAGGATCANGNYVLFAPPTFTNIAPGAACPVCQGAPSNPCFSAPVSLLSLFSCFSPVPFHSFFFHLFLECCFFPCCIIIRLFDLTKCLFYDLGCLRVPDGGFNALVSSLSPSPFLSFPCLLLLCVTVCVFGLKHASAIKRSMLSTLPDQGFNLLQLLHYAHKKRFFLRFLV